MKKTIFISLALIVVLILFFSCNSTNINKTGILVCDTFLFEDSKCANSVTGISKNDLVYVVSKDKDSYYVQLPVMSIPPTEGYIPKNCVSFDTSIFFNANFGVLPPNTILYNSPSLEDIYSILETKEVVNIIKRNEMWVLCEFTGGREAKWVESKNIKYELKY